MTFKEKVQNMSSKEIIMSMVEGLQNPVTKINMNTYGSVYDGVCHGCAATNTICKIGGYTVKNLLGAHGSLAYLMEQLNEDKEFIYKFENAIDDLRRGDIYRYNTSAKEYDFAPIEKGWGDNDDNFDNSYYKLYSDYTNEDLTPYIELANKQ